jgi:adenylosuccinate lyase
VSGDQWNEGDVSCSVVRRVALPDAFLAIDGLFETFLTVLGEFGAYPAVIERELARYLPFLGDDQGAGRGGARRGRPRDRPRGHQGARRRRRARDARGRAADNDLLDRLAADERLPLTGALDALFATPLSFTGTRHRAGGRVRRPVAEVVAGIPRPPVPAGEIL